MSFPERHGTMPDELQIIPILCRKLSHLYLIQPAFHELVLVPSSGRLSLLYFHIFTVLLSFIFSTCPVFARVGVGSLFCVHLKRLTNLVTGWIAASHQPLCFASLISHIAENTLYYMVDVHRARTSLRTHPVTMATSINAQIFLPTYLSENTIFNYDSHMTLVLILRSDHYLPLHWHIYSVLLS